MAQLNKIPKQVKDIAWTRMDEKVVLLDTRKGSIFHELNEVGSFIWEKLDGKNDAEAITRDLVEEFEVSEEKARSDVSKFLDRLDKNNLTQL